MSRTIWVGAVAYDPKVVTIWEGMRRYFHEEAHLPVEVVLFQSYEMQVAALLAAPTDPMPRIDIAWNTNLAYLQANSWSNHRCRPIAMRDTDLGWTTIIVARCVNSVWVSKMTFAVSREHIAEARRLVQRQKGLIIRLRAAGVNTWDVQRILWLLEANLRRFEEYRELLKADAR